MKSVAEAMEHIGEEVDVNVARGMNAVFRIETEEGKGWTLTVSEGRFSVNGHNGQVDCTLRGEEEDLARIFLGEQDLLTAIMQGRVEISGNIQCTQKLVTLLRSRHA